MNFYELFVLIQPHKPSSIWTQQWTILFRQISPMSLEIRHKCPYIFEVILKVSGFSKNYCYFSLFTTIYSQQKKLHFHVYTEMSNKTPSAAALICQSLECLERIKFLCTYLKHKHHACYHGVHVVLAQLFAEGRTHGGQGLQVLLQDLFAHVGQHLWGVSLQVELHPAPMSLLCHTVLFKSCLWIGEKRGVMFYWGLLLIWSCISIKLGDLYEKVSFFLR